MEDIFLHAVDQSNPRAVAVCLSKGVYPNLFDYDDMAALHNAATKGDLLVARELLNHPQINVNLKTPATGYTPLMCACLYQERPFVRALLRKGANPNLVNDKRQSALHMACNLSNTGIVTDLTKAGATINVCDEFDNSPLSISVSDHPSEAIARHLLKRGAKASGVKQFPLLLECVLNCNDKKRLDILKVILQYNVDINCIHPVSHMNCLHYVGITGYLPAAEFLLVHGANLGQIDKSNRLPLHVAEDHENKLVAKLYRRWTERRKVYFSSAENIVQDIHRLYE